jgi:hypothetical protein
VLKRGNGNTINTINGNAVNSVINYLTCGLRLLQVVSKYGEPLMIDQAGFFVVVAN